MVYRYLPLNGLRAFEAAARHRSFKKAAEELFVTPTAVSHQIKTLEDGLGVQFVSIGLPVRSRSRPRALRSCRRSARVSSVSQRRSNRRVTRAGSAACL